ncbi:MAG: hypothetical protein SVU24_05325 [Pseudomonadota bacterium]|jgi:hypothetical protein|nr:hypothetical protein [Pseudomonadota bacterium]
MLNIDKYSLISFAPSVAIIAAMLAMTFFGVRSLKRAIARDAVRAEASQRKYK